MTATISSAFISQFSDNLFSLLEQKGSKLRPAMKIETARGEKHFFDRLGSFTATKIISRAQETNLQDPSHSRRMATVDRYEATTYLDDMDKLKMLIDPSSDYAQKLARAHGRNLDDVILTAMLGTAATGQTGTGSQAFDSNQQIAHGSTAFSVAKLNEGLRLLEANDVDVDGIRLYLAAGASAIKALFGENDIVSFDFQNTKALSDGKLPMFRGVNIIRTQRIPDQTSGSVFRCVLFSEDTMRVALSKDIEVKTGEDVTKNFLMVIASYMMFGAVRMEEESVVDILYQ
jgi:hypothetical protein